MEDQLKVKDVLEGMMYSLEKSIAYVSSEIFKPTFSSVETKNKHTLFLKNLQKNLEESKNSMKLAIESSIIKEFLEYTTYWEKFFALLETTQQEYIELQEFFNQQEQQNNQQELKRKKDANEILILILKEMQKLILEFKILTAPLMKIVESSKQIIESIKHITDHVVDSAFEIYNKITNIQPILESKKQVIKDEIANEFIETIQNNPDEFKQTNDLENKLKIITCNRFLEMLIEEKHKQLFETQFNFIVIDLNTIDSLLKGSKSKISNFKKEIKNISIPNMHPDKKHHPIDLALKK